MDRPIFTNPNIAKVFSRYEERNARGDTFTIDDVFMFGQLCMTAGELEGLRKGERIATEAIDTVFRPIPITEAEEVAS